MLCMDDDKETMKTLSSSLAVIIHVFIHMLIHNSSSINTMACEGCNLSLWNSLITLNETMQTIRDKVMSQLTTECVSPRAQSCSVAFKQVS